MRGSLTADVTEQVSLKAMEDPTRKLDHNDAQLAQALEPYL